MNDNGTVCSFSCRLRSCFQIFHGAQICSFCCCTSDVGRLAHQPCCHEPSCTLLGLQPISSMFGVRVCGSPPHLMMNGAYSSKCPPKLSQGTLVRFRKIARRLSWRVSSLLETPLSRASFHKACFMYLVSLGVQRFWFKAKVWVATACQPLALPFATSLNACP